MIRRRRVGAKARARIRAGGPTSTHRPALSVVEYSALRVYVRTRDGFACRHCYGRGKLEVDHVVARSHGGPDHRDNLITLCRGCHARKGGPYAKGRLVIRALGGERFTLELVTARDKWAVRAAEVQVP